VDSVDVAAVFKHDFRGYRCVTRDGEDFAARNVQHVESVAGGHFNRRRWA